MQPIILSGVYYYPHQATYSTVGDSDMCDSFFLNNFCLCVYLLFIVVYLYLLSTPKTSPTFLHI